MPNPTLRPRVSLQTAPATPDEVATNPMCERSVVSELTTNNSPLRAAVANSSVASSHPYDPVEYNEIVRTEMERDHNGGDGGDSDVEGDEAFLHSVGV